MRFLLSTLIAFTLSFSPATHAGLPYVDLKEVVSEFNSSKSRDALLNAQPDFKKFQKEHSLQNEKMPTAELLENDIVFKEYPDYKLRFNREGNLQVWFKDKSVDVSEQMTLEEMKTKIESLVPSKKFTLMSLFIEEAHAGTLGIVVLAFAAIMVYGLYGMKLKSKLAVSSAVDLRNCRMVESEATSVAKTDAVDAYNKLSETFIKICLPGSTMVPNGYSKEACENITKTKICYKKFIGDDESVNDDDRSSRDFFYSPKEDKFKPGSSRQ